MPRAREMTVAKSLPSWRGESVWEDTPRSNDVSRGEGTGDRPRQGSGGAGNSKALGGRQVGSSRVLQLTAPVTSGNGAFTRSPIKQDSDILAHLLVTAPEESNRDTSLGAGTRGKV